MNNLEILENYLQEKLSFTSQEINLSQSNDNTDSDYQSAIALRCYKKNKFKTAKEYCNFIIKSLNNNCNENIESVFCSGPGFLNLSIKNNYLYKIIDQFYLNKTPIISKITNPKKIVIDYSSPNIAKQMHVGHLRSTIIGDVIGNIFEYKGHNVIRVNHIGDWGTQFGMLIAYIEEKNIDLNELEKSNIQDLHQWYKDSKKLFDSNEDFNTLAHQRVVDLQNNDDKCIQIWELICKISKSSYQEIYNILNISPNLKDTGESFYNKFLIEVEKELEDKKLIKIDNNAKLLFLDKKKPPLIIKKGDGGYGYDSTDLAALKYRIEELKADQIIYVTDIGQKLHFDMLFKANNLIKWSEKEIKLNHVSFGIVLGEDGKRIKSRSGDSFKLMDLLDESYKAFLNENKTRKQDDNDYNTCLIADSEMDKLAKLIGYSAIKYADLKQNRNNNYQFDFKKMVDNKGDTIVYQLYAWVRIRNLLEKSSYNYEDLENINYKIETNSKIELEYERSLVLHITQFEEILNRTIDSLLPHYLCEYIYKLTNKFNGFYKQCKIIGSSNEQTRIKLVLVAFVIYSEYFKIMGIPAEKIRYL